MNKTALNRIEDEIYALKDKRESGMRCADYTFLQYVEPLLGCSPEQAWSIAFKRKQQIGGKPSMSSGRIWCRSYNLGRSSLSSGFLFFEYESHR